MLEAQDQIPAGIVIGQGRPRPVDRAAGRRCRHRTGCPRPSRTRTAGRSRRSTAAPRNCSSGQQRPHSEPESATISPHFRQRGGRIASSSQDADLRKAGARLMPAACGAAAVPVNWRPIGSVNGSEHGSAPGSHLRSPLAARPPRPRRARAARARFPADRDCRAARRPAQRHRAPLSPGARPRRARRHPGAHPAGTRRDRNADPDRCRRSVNAHARHERPQLWSRTKSSCPSRSRASMRSSAISLCTGSTTCRVRWRRFAAA